MLELVETSAKVLPLELASETLVVVGLEYSIEAALDGE